MGLFFLPKNISGKLFKAYLNLPDHPSKIRIENLMGSIFFKNGIQVINKEGVVFQLEANDWMTRIIIEEGCYEEKSIRLAQSLLTNGGVFFDIGANFGLYSCILSKHPNVKTYSFEPNYNVVGNLIRNIKQNKISENTTVVNAAISDKNRLVNFYVPEKKNKGTGKYAKSDPAGKNNGLYISTVSLEDTIKYFGITYINLIKIDIEGNEMDVLGSFNFDSIPVYNIIMEFKEHNTMGLIELKSFFESKNYSMKNISGDPVKDENDIQEDNLWLVKNNI